jgi:Penicillinase repressor
MKERTVRSALRPSQETGCLIFEHFGNNYAYHDRLSASKAAEHAVRQLDDRFCVGLVEQVFTGMVDGRTLSVEQLEDLTR